MAYYEQKEIPAGSGNLYWYERILTEGRQKSRYIGKQLPLELQVSQQKYEADRKLESDRRIIEQKIAELRHQLAQLKSI